MRSSIHTHAALENIEDTEIEPGLCYNRLRAEVRH